MKPTRSEFLKSAAFAVAGLSLPKLSIGHHMPPASSGLESVAEQFLLKPDLIFLNNGTFGPSPKSVVDALMVGLADVTERGKYGMRKQEAIDSLAMYLGTSSDELAMTHSTTEGINMMANGIALKAGDEIILTLQEHVGNYAPWLYRAKMDKLVVRTFKLGQSLAETLANLKKVVTAKTKVIAVPHVTCTNGQVLPIKEICSFAKTKNIITCIDGAHGAGMLDIDLKQLGCDFYAGCCHKWLLAAQGTGYLYVNSASTSKIKHRFIGAEGCKKLSENKGEYTLDLQPVNGHSFMFGTQSGALLNSVVEAVRVHQNWGKKQVMQKVLDTAQYLYEGVQALGNKIEILSPKEKASRSAMISFRLAGGKDTKAVYQYLMDNNFTIRYVAEGDCNCLRVSTHVYNTSEQIDRFLQKLATKL